jgi:hypothetical protein
MKNAEHNFLSYHTAQRCICMLLCLCLTATLCFSLTGASKLRAYAEEILLEETGEHVHTESCYSVGNHLVCELEESPGHQHTDSCYGPIRGELWCTDITGEHMHSDDCYTWTTGLLCGLEEGEGAHTHSEDCYEPERVLICGLEETEAEELPEIIEIPEEPEIIEMPEEPEIIEELIEDEAPPAPTPTMNPGDGIVSLLQLERELSFADKSDPTADVEDEVDWWRMFADMELSGNWAEDLIKVALSQVGYTESELNYVAEDPWHPKGYTRYGAWYGIPYGDWCAMFISFCLYYAEIPDSAVPYACHCLDWVTQLRDRGLYRNWDEGYEPKPGDLVFFDFDMDEKPEHVGIIRDVDLEKGWLFTIEGNRYDYVEEFVLTMDDYAIIGYGVLPENPAYDPENPGVVRQNGEVEIPPETPAPTPPTWDSVLDAAAGIKSVSITPAIESSWVTY